MITAAFKIDTEEFNLDEENHREMKGMKCIIGLEK
jgi:hypothetical protein